MGVWRQVADWTRDMCLDSIDNQVEFWDNVFKQGVQNDVLAVSLNALWLIWFNRNKYVYDGWCKNPHLVGLSARRQSLEYMGVRAVAEPRTFREHIKEAGYGVLARDEEGAILFSAATRADFIQSPVYAEVHAILWGLEVAKEQGGSPS
ncbi:hypothetical protein REPUB_Repub03eG0186400 [Reevesia pubescens]